MGLSLKSGKITVVVGNCCNVGYVTKVIARRIFYCIKVEILRSTVHRRQRKLEMLGKEFLRCMQHLIRSRWIIRHPLLRWKVSSVIELFPFIDPRSNYIYVNPDKVDKCGLRKEVHARSWLVQLDTGTKKRVHHWVRAFAFELNGMPTSTHLNVLLLGSYNMLLGIDWLYLHRANVDCYENTIEFLYDDGEKRILQGKKNATSVRRKI